jgi:hypothetical protein
MKDITQFLKRFHTSRTVDEVFTQGCCYWFAQIMLARFQSKDPILMYAPVDNHFGVKIDSKVWDITGDCTDKYEWIKWSDFDDDLERKRIVRDCVMF